MTEQTEQKPRLTQTYTVTISVDPDEWAAEYHLDPKDAAADFTSYLDGPETIKNALYEDIGASNLMTIEVTKQ